MSARRCCCGGGGGPFFPASTRCNDLAAICGFPTSLVMTWAFTMQMSRPDGPGLSAVRVRTAFELSAILTLTVEVDTYVYRNTDATTWTGPVRSEFESAAAGLRVIDSTIEAASSYPGGLTSMFIRCDFLGDFARQQELAQDVRNETIPFQPPTQIAIWPYTQDGAASGNDAGLFLLARNDITRSRDLECVILGDPWEPEETDTDIQWTLTGDPVQSGTVAQFRAGDFGDWTTLEYSNVVSSTL